MDSVIKIGAKVPLFNLSDLDGQMVGIEELNGRIVVVNFWSAECDWCLRIDGELLAYASRWGRRVKVLWIASNGNESQALIARVAAERKLPAVLIDEGHHVADLYGATVTPHFFILDSGGRIRYQGAWDDITFRRRVATRQYVDEAIEALLKGAEPGITETPPYGCTLVRLMG